MNQRNFKFLLLLRVSVRKPGDGTRLFLPVSDVVKMGCYFCLKISYSYLYYTPHLSFIEHTHSL